MFCMENIQSERVRHNAQDVAKLGFSFGCTIFSFPSPIIYPAIFHRRISSRLGVLTPHRVSPLLGKVCAYSRQPQLHVSSICFFYNSPLYIMVFYVKSYGVSAIAKVRQASKQHATRAGVLLLCKTFQGKYSAFFVGQVVRRLQTQRCYIAIYLHWLAIASCMNF